MACAGDRSASTGTTLNTSHLGELSFVTIAWMRWLQALCSLRQQQAKRESMSTQIACTERCLAKAQQRQVAGLQDDQLEAQDCRLHGCKGFRRGVKSFDRTNPLGRDAAEELLPLGHAVEADLQL